jgi:hypothetical protein
MKLDLLRKFREQFKHSISSTSAYEQAFKWECQDIFKHKWNIEAPDFGQMYDESLSHPQSGRLWGGNHQSAKSVMLSFIDCNREFVRSMFRDLFSEQKDLIMRIERFQYYCDQLLDELKNSRKRMNHHFHNDFYMPTLYLSMMFPFKYCPFEPDLFAQMLRAIEAKDTNYITLDRFQKVTTICQSQLLQDDEILPLLESRLNLNSPELIQSKWLTYEFYHYIASLSGPKGSR